EGVDFLKDVLRSSVSLAPESYLIGHAVQLGEKELIQLLLKRKASLRCPTLADPLLTTKLYAELLDDINAVDYAGNSLLHYAVKDDSVASVEYLLEQGANPNLPDRNGKTAKELAQSPAMRSLFYKGAL
ncbi:MAG TPA: ankyrin repeat domain-containing protein, partial [Chlamydiales bacterium]|nr:ankyrin repeat domain-containing protein [Chlamydiales bacterium]